jgi:hypothetical protein
MTYPARKGGRFQESDDALDNGTKEPDRELLLADYHLAQRCAAGEVAAWEELYVQCHDRLLGFIRDLLGDLSEDASLVDELAARVWYALVEKDGELLTRYDPARGARLITYMRALSKDMMSRYFRSERRRRNRELIASRQKPTYHDAEIDHTSSTLEEFLTTLSRQDHQFCTESLMGDGGNGRLCDAIHETPNVWQKSRRLYRRLLGFLDWKERSS